MSLYAHNSILMQSFYHEENNNNSWLRINCWLSWKHNKQSLIHKLSVLPNYVLKNYRYIDFINKIGLLAYYVIIIWVWDIKYQILLLISQSRRASKSFINMTLLRHLEEFKLCSTYMLFNQSCGDGAPPTNSPRSHYIPSPCNRLHNVNSLCWTFPPFQNFPVWEFHPQKQTDIIHVDVWIWIKPVLGL